MGLEHGTPTIPQLTNTALQPVEHAAIMLNFKIEHNIKPSYESTVLS